jgi:uncharacterized protein (TIGR02391 family)
MEEIDRAIKKLQRRVEELEGLDVRGAVIGDTGAISAVRSNIVETIREIFGSNSPEFQEHEHLDIWAGSLYFNMGAEDVIEARERGKTRLRGVLTGLITRILEKREDLISEGVPSPGTYFHQLNLHPRIAEVANDLYLDGYHWEAVFAAAKALVNYVKEKSGRHDLDGTPLMRTVFSKNTPVLGFNDLADQTDIDEQEGMMHLFEGAVLGIRNPGGHSFPEGTEQRAMEYVSLLSLLAYRVQEAKRRKTT